MTSHKRPIGALICASAAPVAGKCSVKKSRHVPLDLKRALDKCHKWSSWLERKEELGQRDEKRIVEAFALLAKEEDSAYSDFLRDAKLVGGFELVLLLAVSLGKAAFRDMKAEVKWRLPIKVAETKCHQSESLRQLVRHFVKEGG